MPQRPVAIYGFTPGRTDIFWCALDRRSIMQTWFDRGRWQTRTIAQAYLPFGLAPAIYSDQPGKMDIGWTDGVGQLWYMRWRGSEWTSPTRLNPSEMTPVGGPAPVNFSPGSPLIACQRPENRRSQNTEFLICDGTLNLWNLSFDGSKWYVADTRFSGMAYPPVQLKTSYKTTKSPELCLFWCRADRLLRFSLNKFAGEAPSTFGASDFLWGGSSILAQMQRAKDPLSTYLLNKKPPSDEGGFLNFMNGVLTDPELQKHIAGVATRGETLALLERHPKGGENLRRLNRMLLADAYDGLITKTLEYFGPVETEPAVGSRAFLGSLDLFWLIFRGERPVVYGARCINNKWSTHYVSPQDRDYIAPALLAPAAVTSTDSRWTRIDVLWRAANGDIYDSYEGAWNDPKSGWTTTRVAPGSLQDSLPAGVVHAGEALDVFWLSADGRLHMARSPGGAGWTAPEVIADSPRMPAPSPFLGGFYPPAYYATLGEPVGPINTAARMDVAYAGPGSSARQASGDGTRWYEQGINEGGFGANTPAVGAALDGSPYGMMFWADEQGKLRYRTYDPGNTLDPYDTQGGTWHAMPLANPIASPVTWCPPRKGQGSEIIAEGSLHWINAGHRLCEINTTVRFFRSWSDHVVDFSPVPGGTQPQFSTRFAPAPLRSWMNAVSDSQLLLCDVDMNLWLTKRSGDRGRYGAPQELHLGPVAFAPVLASWRPSPGMGDVLIFWCARDDRSLRVSCTVDGVWSTATVDPGPMATAPALLHTPRGHLFLFWGAQDGSLKHAVVGGFGSRPNMYGTEIVNTGMIGSAPAVLWNEALRQPFVFWLDDDGELKQSWLAWKYVDFGDPPFTQVGRVPKWQTMNIAMDAYPVSYDGRRVEHRILLGLGSDTKNFPYPPRVRWPNKNGAYRLQPAKGVPGSPVLTYGKDSRINLSAQNDSGDFPERQRWIFEQVSNKVYRIRSDASIADDRTYLNGVQDGSVVDLYFEEDESGRQQWKLTPTSEGAFTIEASGGVGPRKYLSCSADGSRIDLWNADDASGRQRWRLIPA